MTGIPLSGYFPVKTVPTWIFSLWSPDILLNSVSVDFEELMLTPFSRIISLTENIVDWSQLFTDRHYEEWSILSELTQKIQMGTARLTYVDDGAMNSLGDWVYINTGEPQEEEIPGVNCSWLP
jgi:hypothetical protein